MTTILLLLFAGVVPVFTQYNHDYQQPRYSDYGDFGRFSSNDERQQGPDFGIQQPSFFGSFGTKMENDNHQSASVSSVIGGSYGGLTPPPPTASEQVSNMHKYFTSERHAIVPSSLRELEESYIRSLSTNGNSRRQPYLGPFGENRNQKHEQQRMTQQNGVENYSGFIMTKRHYNKNDHIRSSQQHQYRQQLRAQPQSQSAPITYGFPLLNQQASGTNSLDIPFGKKESGKYFDYSQKNIVPTFPDFSDRPPVPEEPEIPSEEEVEEATRKPPGIYVLPTPSNLDGFSRKPTPSPLASPPPIFDPSFPEPVLQRGFIPSFGPPTKEPYFPFKSGKGTSLLNEQELFNNHLASQVEVSTTSPVPVLRPEYPTDEKDTDDVLPDGVSSATPSSTEKPHEGTIYKHISVHVPAEDLDEEVSAPKVIKVAKKPEKHIKVIFIKPPDSPAHKTEVEVPAGPQQKTLVYVLSESGGIRTPIKLVTPTPLKPAPPQVFFLRYTDPHTGASQPTPSSADREDLPENKEERTTQRPSVGPPIKQLASPPDPDAEILRSGVFPTYPSEFSSPTTTAIAQQLALQSALSSPTLFTNNKYNSIFTDPTGSKYQGALSSSNSLNSDNSANNDNNRLEASKYTNNPFSQSPTQSHADANNPFSQNYYSSLYHLYPPPIPSVPNQNLLSLYYNPHNFPQYRPHQAQPPFYRLGQTKSGIEPSPSSIQGLYTVAPNDNSLPGINFNSLVQNPDGKNPPRSPRNFVMMNYAPTYMPSATGSEHVPVFTSPADFIKSLLGDSYMYYNHIANNSVLFGTAYNHTAQNSEIDTTPTSSTTTTPAPPPAKNLAQHHTIPLILNWKNFQNLSSQSTSDHSQQPFALVIGNSFGRVDTGSNNNNNNNANFHLQNAQPVYPHLRPLFPFTSTTTTPKPQPRISWAPPIVSPSPPAAASSKQIAHNLPVVINRNNNGGETRNNNQLTPGHNLVSHFNSFFHTLQHDHHHHNASEANENDSEQTTEYNQSDSSSSSSDETSESEYSSSAQQDSGEEIIPIYYEPTRVKSSESGKVDGSSTSSTIHANPSSNSSKESNPSRSSKRGGSSGSRKRVNPAHVKPGRRLRKVRKPHKNRKNKSRGNNEPTNQAQTSTNS